MTRHATPRGPVARATSLESIVRASESEFRHRFWIISAIFFVAFACYRIDHLNLGVALARLIVPGVDLDEARARSVTRAIFFFAASIAIAAAWLRSWASAYLTSEVVHDTRLHARSLVADGPYRHVRNPLYLGNLLLAIAMSFLASRLGAAVLILGHVIFLLRLIGREEEALAAGDPERFAAYRAAVPRLLPSPGTRVPAGDRAPRWAQGVAGEAFFWIFALALLVFAWTLDSRVVPMAVGIGFLVYWILFAVWKRRARSRERAA